MAGDTGDNEGTAPRPLLSTSNVRTGLEPITPPPQRVREAGPGIRRKLHGQPQDLPLSCLVISDSLLVQELIIEWLRHITKKGKINTVKSWPPPTPDGDGKPPYDLLVVGHFLAHIPWSDLLAKVTFMHEIHPETPIIVVSGNDDPDLVSEIMRSGASCFIPTQLPLAVAVAAVRLVLSGGTYAPPNLDWRQPHQENEEASPVQPSMFDDPALNAVPSRTTPDLVLAEFEQKLKLSRREAQVLQLLRLGHSNRQVGEELNISENTVMVHVQHLMRKLGARNRTQAVFKANELLEDLRKKLIEEDRNSRSEKPTGT